MQITRTHEICMGHRVYGHESKCRNLHGHNYVFHLTVKAKDGLDSLGRVVDFSEIKTVLCEWLESNWDHKTLLYTQDPLLAYMWEGVELSDRQHVEGVIPVPFNPTAENIAYYFLYHIAFDLCRKRDWYLYSITLFETGKCSVTVTLDSIIECEIRRQIIQVPPTEQNLPF